MKLKGMREKAKYCRINHKDNIKKRLPEKITHQEILFEISLGKLE